MRESENVELERVRDVCYLLSVVHFPAHELLIYIYTCIYMHTNLTACSSLQAMLEDKLRSTDWDATYSAIEETVCKESYLEWLRENERKRGGHSGAQVHVRTHVHVYNGCLYSLIHGVMLTLDVSVCMHVDVLHYAGLCACIMIFSSPTKQQAL